MPTNYAISIKNIFDFVLAVEIKFIGKICFI